MRKDASLKNQGKKVIMHATTAMMTMKLKYTHLWHEFLVMKKRENKDYGDSLQLTNWILDSGATCHMTPEVTDFIPGSLEDTDKFIEVADGHHVTSKQKGSVRIQMCDKSLSVIVAHLYAY